MSARHNGTRLWEIRWSFDEKDRAFFAGIYAEMVAEISRRHRETGIQHAAREVKA